jgi:hypothetical protein
MFVPGRDSWWVMASITWLLISIVTTSLNSGGNNEILEYLGFTTILVVPIVIGWIYWWSERDKHKRLKQRQFRQL